MSNKRLHRCCFTGHRPEKLNESEDEIKRRLEQAINGWIKAELFTDLHITGEKPVDEEIGEYIKFFNEERPAYSLNYLTPKQYREAYADI